MTSFRDDMTLKEARDLLRTLVDDGHACPLCTRFAKVYRRKVTSSMARMLIRMYRAGGTDWVYLPSLRDGNGAMDTTMTQYWGLIEEERVKREDGGRAGWWRLTPLATRFVLGQATVPKYARIYDGRCLGLTGEPVTIHDCLGSKFNYRELMAA